MRDDAIARQRLCRPIRHLHLPDTSEDLELKRIYLLGRFQGSGVGKYLVRTAVSHATALGAKRLLLGVYRHNHPAIAF